MPKYTLSSYEPVYVLSPEIEIPDETIQGEMLASLREHHCAEGEEPRLTDAWISSHTDEFETVKQFETVVRYNLYREARKYQRYQDEDVVCKELATRLEQEIPENMVEESRYAANLRFDQYLREHEMKMEEYCAQNDISEDELHAQLLEQALQGLREDMALEAWAEHFELKLDSDDIYACIPGKDNAEKLKMRQQVEQNGGMAGLEDYALKVKAMKDVMANAMVKRKKYQEYAPLDEVSPELMDFMAEHPELVIRN